jgi:DNA repair exonuclease SbcCD ATPase subunit
MTADTDVPKTQDARMLHDSRETVRAVQFFVAAMATQLEELDTRLGRVRLITTETEFEEKLGQVETERDQALQSLQEFSTRLQDAERELTKLQEELVRQHVTFADHHAAKQEIARLRSELESFRHMPTPPTQQQQSQKRWWQLGKS